MIGMEGIIAKGVGGLYYVYGSDGKVYESKARGRFRKDGMKPLVGDRVLLTDISSNTAVIDEILTRKNEVLRPACANIDQVMIVFAAAKPSIQYDLLNRFLVRMELERIPVLIGISKTDLSSEDACVEIRSFFETTGYPLFFFSVNEKYGMDELKTAFLGKTTAFAGPSGVGKSSLINYFCPEANMETGDISRKIERGKHTTRHAEIFAMESGTGYLMDTPGFSSLFLNEIKPLELWRYFPEMISEEQYCRFSGCSHMEEPDCGIKQAVATGKISKIRYEGYRQIYNELANIRRF